MRWRLGWRRYPSARPRLDKAERLQVCRNPDDPKIARMQQAVSAWLLVTPDASVEDHNQQLVNSATDLFQHQASAPPISTWKAAPVAYHTWKTPPPVDGGCFVFGRHTRLSRGLIENFENELVLPKRLTAMLARTAEMEQETA